MGTRPGIGDTDTRSLTTDDRLLVNVDVFGNFTRMALGGSTSGA